jgi:glycosyltransferase involved in cell wall biosynthesis
MATGGAQKVLLDQAHWFYTQGEKVTAAFLYDKEDLHDTWQQKADWPIHNMGLWSAGTGKLHSLLNLIKGVWCLCRLLHQGRFDVIETFTHDSNMLVLPFAWLFRVPVRIATHHGVIENFPRGREWFHTWLVNLGIATVLVAVSTKTYQCAIHEKINPKRLVLIKNGIPPLSLEGINRPEVRKEAGVSSDEIFLLAVGRLVYQKAHETLVSAMRIVREKYPRVKLGICGDGVLRVELQKQIETLGLANSVTLLGRWDNVTKFLAAADIFVLPSRWEGLPIALLEAMSVGLPVVATNVEGVDDVITHGVQGLLVPVEDSTALANAILQLLYDQRLLHTLGTAARLQVMQNYTEDIMCEQYRTIMEKYLYSV